MDMDNRDKLLALATKVKGMKPGDPKAEAILDSLDDDKLGWTGYWPVAKNGVFTGTICGVDGKRDGPEAGYELSEDLMYAIQRFD
jgi:hypothetical protein